MRIRRTRLSSLPSLMRLLRIGIAPYRGVLAAVVVFQAIQTAAVLTLPTLNSQIIDQGVLVGDVGYIWAWGGVMLAVAGVQGAFAIAAVREGSRIALAFGRDVRGELFHRVTSFSAREVGTFGAPSLITRITNDVQQIQLVVVLTFTMAIGAPISVAVGLFMAIREDAGLSVVFLVALPIMAIVLAFIARLMVPAFRGMQLGIDETNRIFREQITGLRVVRAFAREPEERQRLAVANTELTRHALRGGRLISFTFPFALLVVNVASVAVIWLGAARIEDGATTVGSLVAYLGYLVQILMSTVMLTFVMAMLPRAAVSAERIVEVLDTEPSVVPPAAPVRALPAPGTVEFRDVSFRYPGAEAPVLSDVSFAIRPGQTTAVIGSTGAGKSTLVDLIPRLFDATDGTVLVGGVDVRELDPEILAGAIGLVPQKAYLFAGTIASNLRVGRADATEDEMWEALRIAQAADFVAAMPDGLDAPIEQGGANVSGGQRQRLSIARALIRRPSAHLFDDSFSALDATTEAALRHALAANTADAAVLVVAQRVSSIVDADEIIVLEDGIVMGQGRHEELLAECPTYLEIVESQGGVTEVPA